MLNALITLPIVFTVRIQAVVFHRINISLAASDGELLAFAERHNICRTAQWTN